MCPFLRGVYPACPERSLGELAEGLRMTLGISSVGSSYTATNWVQL